MRGSARPLPRLRPYTASLGWVAWAEAVRGEYSSLTLQRQSLKGGCSSSQRLLTLAATRSVCFRQKTSMLLICCRVARASRRRWPWLSVLINGNRPIE
jgi:hypothetical protein